MGKHIQHTAPALLLASLIGMTQVAMAADKGAANSATQSESLAPTAEDMAKAHEDRLQGKVTPRNNDKKTKIEAVRDQDNRVTEYVVTPGSTHIPYSMENQAERPINSAPGSNSQGTLGPTKQLKFGF